MHFREKKENRDRNQSHNNEPVYLDVLPPHQGGRVGSVLCREMKKAIGRFWEICPRNTQQEYWFVRVFFTNALRRKQLAFMAIYSNFQQQTGTGK